MLCTLVIDTGTFPYALREKERLDVMHLGDCYRELKNRRLDSKLQENQQLADLRDTDLLELDIFFTS